MYHDAYPSVSCLPPEQRGELLSALFLYAIAAGEGEASVAAALERAPALLPEARMAFRFMADAIRRDTDKWKKRQESCRQAAQRRTAAPGTAEANKAAVMELQQMMKNGEL